MRRVYFPAFMESRFTNSSGGVARMLASAFGINLTSPGRPGPCITDRRLASRSNVAMSGSAEGRILGALRQHAKRPRHHGAFGLALTVSWVALGLSYTLFDNYLISFSAIRGAFR